MYPRKDTYPLPRMDECLDSLGEAKYFTTLDCNSGYWQIPIAKEDRNKTTFTCHDGTYRFLRMPFGLCNAPATFQRTVDILLSGYRWKTCLVYLDDVIIFSISIEEHLKHVDEVLEKQSACFEDMCVWGMGGRDCQSLRTTTIAGQSRRSPPMRYRRGHRTGIIFSHLKYISNYRTDSQSGAATSLGNMSPNPA